MQAMLSQTQKRSSRARSSRHKQPVTSRQSGSKTTSFYVRMQGDTMVDAGINDNDILVACPTKRPQSGSIVVAILEGALVVRRYFTIKNHVCLAPENVNYPATEVTQDATLDICGVVIKVIHATEAEHREEA